MRTLRRRFWVETVVGAVGLVLGVLTVAVPDWIERISGAEPDAGSGAAEWALAAALLAFAVLAGLLARAELMHARPPATS